MQRLFRSFLVMLTISSGAAPALAQQIKPAIMLNIPQAQEDLAFALGVQATVWSYPLVISAATAAVVTATDRALPNGRAPFNTFGHVARLVTAADKDVVSSNADTVYSSLFLDLKQGAALISVPDIGNRYYSLMLEDAYTNVFGYIGSRATGTKAGKYMIAGPGWKGETPPGIVLIQAPTTLVWVIGRTLVDGPHDMANVAVIQSQFQVAMVAPVLDATPIKQRWKLNLQPRLVPVEQVEVLDWKTYFQWAGRLLMDSPPPASDSALYRQFEAIGLSVKDGFDDTHLSEAVQKGLARGYSAGKQVVKMEALKTGGMELNGWAYNLNAGNWGQDFNLRSAIAYRSLGQNTPEEALYMNTREDSQKQTLNGSRKYTLTFKKGSLPPVSAFWSVTMYNASNFFADNPLNRYAIGIRTEGLKMDADGSLTLYFQKDAPPGDKRSNWLPAPEGDFRLSLRLYGPKADVLQGNWHPPAVMLQP